ncbi:Alanine--tRNA ligase, cytoplasmic [Dirofilaria immitis]|nr:Alanine--tRNA ligase, cytoplasmic [Dirofilaria immitis]
MSESTIDLNIIANIRTRLSQIFEFGHSCAALGSILWGLLLEVLREICNAFMMNKLWLNAPPCHIYAITCIRLHIRHLSARQIRSSFLEYFKEHDHTYVPSSSVIPEDDSSTTFVNAGMNQFKPLFLGVKYTEGKFAALRNVVNWQKCIRVGGKHNDFDDVGRDLTHHTFFEMLGNYSFGGYAKAEACLYAWNFLTDVLRIPADRLYVTYFSGDENMKLKEDHECRDIWIKLGVPEDRVLGFCSNHNFWEMAETGPCGPCTEIHYDLIGNRKAQKLVNSNNPTVVEVWNLVFMQFSRDILGRISSLPTLYVDCGLGFERLFSKIGEYDGRLGDSSKSKTDVAYRIIADHLRAACIMISDGVEPGSRSRGYHLRRVLRRAALNLTLTLGAERGMLASLVPDFVNHLTSLYGNVAAYETIIAETVMSEERLFWKSYDKGIKVLQQNITSQSHILPENLHQFIRGIAWMLSGTYGLPLAITQKMCNEKGLKVDLGASSNSESSNYKNQLPKSVSYAFFEEISEDSKAKEEPWQKADLEEIILNGVEPTNDSEKYGYRRIELGKYEFPSKAGTVLAVFDVSGKNVISLKSGELGSVIMDATIFLLNKEANYMIENIVFTVNSAKRRNGYIIHTGEVADGQTLEKGLNLTQIIDPKQRFSLMCGHTATHILHFALENIFGVPIEKVTEIVNEVIENNLNVTVKYILKNELGSIRKNFSSFDISQEANFDGSYRIITIESSRLLGQDIIEPCCGTHVFNTGDIGQFAIIGQKSRGASVRRIYAVTNSAAMESIRNATKLKNKLSLALSNFDETFIDTRKLIEGFHKNLPLPSKPLLYEMLKRAKKRNKYLSQKLRLLGAD